VTFPMFAKIEVNGDNAAPLYGFLENAAPEANGSTDIPWNFTKFLVDREGKVLERFGTRVTPEEIGPKLKGLL
jgi:glutathione peroxidase